MPSYLTHFFFCLEETATDYEHGSLHLTGAAALIE